MGFLWIQYNKVERGRNDLVNLGKLVSVEILTRKLATKVESSSQKITKCEINESAPVNGAWIKTNRSPLYVRQGVKNEDISSNQSKWEAD